MRPQTIVVIAVACLTLAACGGTVTGSPVTADVTGSTSTRVITPTQLTGVSPPTTAALNPNVTGTTFDGCASVSDSEITSWELDPTSKVDTKDSKTLGSESVRGCHWKGTKWYLRVYANNGSIADWERPQPQFDRIEPVKIGQRDGWVAHDAPPHGGCTVVLSSQQGIAAVQVDPIVKLMDQGFDACPLATKIMTTIELRIP